MRRATITLTIQGKDVSQDLAPHLLSFSYTDKADDELDDLQLVLEDREGLWQGDWLPKHGDVITAKITTDSFRASGQNRIMGIPFPLPDPVLRSGHVDRRFIHIFKPDIKHVIVSVHRKDLTGGNDFFLPEMCGIRSENRILRVFLPVDPIFAFRVSNLIRFPESSCGIPHSEKFPFLIPQYMGTHQVGLFPASFRFHYRLFSPGKMDSVLALRISDTGSPAAHPLSRAEKFHSGIPHQIFSVFFQYDLAVDIILPSGGKVGR